MLLLTLTLVLYSMATQVNGNADYSNAEKCISTLHDFQESLLSRTVNLDSLKNAFAPTNRQASISFVVQYYFCVNSTDPSLNSSQLLCNDIETWVNDLNAGRTPSVNYSTNYSYVFLWNASPINLFIRPQLLAALSLFTFRIQVPITYIVLDQECEYPISSDESHTTLQQPADDIDVCMKPSPIHLLLNQLTEDLKSFYLHKGSFFTHGTKVNGEQGYPTYYFSPTSVTDDCVLTYFDEYETKRTILDYAVLCTEVFHALFIPFAARQLFERVSLACQDPKSNFIYYFGGSVLTMALTGFAAFISNLVLTVSEEVVAQSVISDVRTNYIVGLAFMFINFFILTPGSILLNLYRIPPESRKKWETLILFFVVVYIIAFAAELFSFHVIYVIMGLIAAPVQTGSLVFFYLTAIFVSAMFFALVWKGWQVGGEKLKDITTKLGFCWFGCDVFLGALIFFLFLAGMCLYLAFYYKMAITVEPYSTQAGFLSSFGSLIPGFIAILAGILQKRLITFLNDDDDSPQPQRRQAPPLRYTRRPNRSKRCSRMPAAKYRRLRKTFTAKRYRPARLPNTQSVSSTGFRSSHSTPTTLSRLRPAKAVGESARLLEATPTGSINASYTEESKYGSTDNTCTVVLEK